MNKPIYIFPLALMLCTATACAPAGRSIQKVSTAVHEESIAMDHRVRDWFDSEDIYGRERNLPPPDTGYCYRTLGEVSCYAYPLPGQERRLVGIQTPPPLFEDNIYPVPETKPNPPIIYAKGETQLVDAPTTVQMRNIPSQESIVLQAEEPVPDYRKPRELIPVFE